jgi:hypothetical protein
LADLDRLVMVWETDGNGGTTREPASVPDFLDYEARGTTLDALAGVIASEVNFSASAVEPVQVAGLRLSHRMLPMLGISPVVGRHFTVEDDTAGGAQVALVSESLWRTTLGASPTIVGQSKRVDDRPYQIVGVVPDASDFGVLQVLTAAAYGRGFAARGERTRVDVWLPLQPDPQALPRARTCRFGICPRIHSAPTSRTSPGSRGTVGARRRTWARRRFAPIRST